jgi:hypothetical protein
MATQDPFAAIGGGVQLANGGWVPKDHPDALAQQQQQPAAQPGAVPGAPAATTVQGQAQNAQTYSAAPGAAPAPNTTNQGTQDVVRNSYLQQATQGTTVDRNDPNFRQQLDPFNAAQERQRRQYLSEQAERMSAQGLGNSGAMQQEARVASERAGQASGLFESQLVQQELKTKRDEIQNALQSLGGMISQDQQMQLQKQLADLDAALRREGFGVQSSLGQGDLGLRRELGMGGLNIDLMRLLQSGDQFDKDLGFRIGDREAYWNNNAILSLMGK